MSNQKTMKEEFEGLLNTDTMVQVRTYWAPGSRRASWFVRLPSGREYCLPDEPKLVGMPEVDRYENKRDGTYIEYWRPMCVARLWGDLVLGNPGSIEAYARKRVKAYWYRRI